MKNKISFHCKIKIQIISVTTAQKKRQKNQNINESFLEGNYHHITIEN